MPNVTFICENKIGNGQGKGKKTVSTLDNSMVHYSNSHLNTGLATNAQALDQKANTPYMTGFNMHH
tara:strand:- start:1181 stop:1378 length:198 start_codon:yes stop_codon:yes gene_type:complete